MNFLYVDLLLRVPCDIIIIAHTKDVLALGLVLDRNIL